MKKLVYLYSVPAFLILFSCGPETRTNYTYPETEEVNTSEEVIEQDIQESEPAQMDDEQEPSEEAIQTEDLPEQISDNVEKDAYLSTLKLDKAVKINNNDQTYYELTFKDDADKIIAVIFDDRGNKLTI
jgi:uncharacterized glyoxalase superfamily metalloenzyme YdcJ